MHHKESDLADISKSKKESSQRTRSISRKLVWILLSLIASLVLIFTRDITGYIIASILIILAVEYHIIAKYIDSSLATPDVIISLTLGYFFSFATFALAPVDTAIAIRNGIAIKEQISFIGEWKFIFWGMTLLNVLIMNTQDQFHRTGHLKFFSRIKATIILSMVAIVIFLVGVVIAFIVTKKIAFDVVIQVFQLLSNIYGIIVLVLLIGYGLVQFPYKLWNATDRSNKLDILLSQAESLHSRFQSTQYEVQMASQKMKSILQLVDSSHPFFEFKDQLTDEIPKLEEHMPFRMSSSTSSASSKLVDLNNGDISEDVIAEARFALKNSKYNFVKVLNKWKQHCDKIFAITKIESLEKKPTSSADSRSSSIDMKSKGKQRTSSSSSSSSKQKPKNDFLNTSFQDQLKALNSKEPYKQLEPIEMTSQKVIGYRVFSVIFMIFSVIIIYSEIVLIFTANPNNGAMLFPKIVGDSTNVGGVTFFILLVLGYIIFCSCYALFDIDLGEGFEIYPYHTHPLTLLFNSGICSTIAFPLCYNVMLMFGQVNNTDLTSNSSFDSFYKPMENLPFLGSVYNILVCIAISAIGLLSLFSSMKSLLSKISKNRITMASEDLHIEAVQEGEKHVLIEWQRRKIIQRITNLGQRGNQQDSQATSNTAQENKNFFEKFLSFFDRKKQSAQNSSQGDSSVQMESIRRATAQQQRKPTIQQQNAISETMSPSSYDSSMDMNSYASNESMSIADMVLLKKAKKQQQNPTAPIPEVSIEKNTINIDNSTNAQKTIQVPVDVESNPSSSSQSKISIQEGISLSINGQETIKTTSKTTQQPKKYSGNEIPVESTKSDQIQQKPTKKSIDSPEVSEPIGMVLPRSFENQQISSNPSSLQEDNKMTALHPLRSNSAEESGEEELRNGKQSPEQKDKLRIQTGINIITVRSGSDSSKIDQNHEKQSRSDSDNRKSSHEKDDTSSVQSEGFSPEINTHVSLDPSPVRTRDRLSGPSNPLHITASPISPVPAFSPEKKTTKQQEKRAKTFKGWVSKKSENNIMRKMKGWTKKYMEFANGSLNYFNDATMTGKQGKIANIVDAILYSRHPKKAKKQSSPDSQLRFFIYAKERKYDFKAETIQEAETWVTLIKESVFGVQDN